MIDVTLPLRLVSLTNQREHWAKKARRAREQRSFTMLYLRANCRGWACPEQRTVTLTRIGKKLLDDDNLRGACKSVRDGVADFLGVDDADPRVTWEYGQLKGKEYAVRIEIKERTE